MSFEISTKKSLESLLYKPLAKIKKGTTMLWNRAIYVEQSINDESQKTFSIG